MKITDIEIRLCKHQEEEMGANELRETHKSDLHFLMIMLKTDAGVADVSMGFAGMGAEMATSIAAQSLKPFFLVGEGGQRLIHMEDLLDGLPPFAFSPIGDWVLHRSADGPPLLRRFISGDLRHIAFVIIADIFEVGEEHILITEDGIIAHIAFVDFRQYAGPDIGVQAGIFFHALGFYANNLPKTLHLVWLLVNL